MRRFTRDRNIPLCTDWADGRDTRIDSKPSRSLAVVFFGDLMCGSLPYWDDATMGGIEEGSVLG